MDRRLRSSEAGEPLIEIIDLQKLFPVRKGVFSRVVGHVHAVDGVSLSVMRGETLGLVGESGCGKTTFGRAILRLVEPTGGKVVFNRQDVLGLHPSQLRAMRKRMQIVFQDPYSSLDPRMTVERIVGEGFAIHGSPKGSKDPNVARRERIHELIEQVGLSHDHLSRLPHEFSGGQRQRIALARSLALDPDFIVLDEPTSALDVSVQAQALNLLKRLQSKLGLSYLFISHDLSVVGHMSDRIAVMYLGKIVELATAEVFLKHAMHPYTQALIASIPIPDPKLRTEKKGIEGEVPSPTNPPKGCRFHPRCPKAFAECGWNAGDLVDWLNARGLTAPGSVIGDEVAGMDADGFVLDLRLRTGSEPGALLEFLRGTMDRSKADVPMFHAIEAIDSVIGDRAVEVRCKAAPMSAEELAKEVFVLIESVAERKEPDHPMHGMITGVRVEKDRCVVAVAETAGENVEAVESFIRGLVKHHRKNDRPEFKGVKRVAGDPATKSVVVSCKKSKEPSKRVAGKVGRAIAESYATDSSHDMGRVLLPLEVKGGRVYLRVMGPEANWDALRSSLQEFFDGKKAAGESWAGSITGLSLKKAKGPKVSVMAKFMSVEEPPMYDMGGGHMVACLLCRPGGQPVS